MAHKQVLFISRVFPPAGGAGVQRSAKFVKYLPRFGWDPIVLTTRRQTLYLRDDSLLDDIPPETAIIRTHTIEPKDSDRSLLRYLIWGPLTPLSVPDMGNWWLPWAIPAAMRELRDRPIRAIYATGAPFSSHILGAILKARSGIPLVLDYRDEWALDRRETVLKPLYWRVLFRRWERVMQHWVVGKADRVILVSESARRTFVNEFGESEKFVVVRNGFDTDDFGVPVLPELSPDKFCVTYTGSTTGLDCRPDSFLKGLRRAINQHSSLGKRIQVHFVGTMHQEDKDLIRELELAPYVRTVGYISHNESVGYLLQTDVLLMLVHTFPFIVPGKVYEYMNARKPVILLSTPDGETRELLERAGVATWADPEDVSDIAEKLGRLFELWANGRLEVQPDETFIRSFSRESQTRKLARILDEITR